MIESIKKAFVLSVKALKLFYVVAAVNIIVNIINVLTLPAPGTVEMTLGKSFLVIGLTLLFSLIAVFIGSGALAYIKELIKAGSTNLASFISNAKKYFLRLLAITLIILLLFLIVGILAFVIFGFMPATLRTILIAPAFIALTIFFIMIPYALVGEDLGIIESVKKGILMGKKHFLRILGILAIMFGVAIVVTIAGAMITGILSLLLRPIAGFITAIITAITNAVMAILVNIAYMDFYLKSAGDVQT